MNKYYRDSIIMFAFSMALATTGVLILLEGRKLSR